LSLTDENLRHLLRRNALNNPGHFHYAIEWLKPGKDFSEDHTAALFDYRFRVYNIVTLFLDSEGIRTLGEVIQMAPPAFAELAKAVGVPKKYVYYVTGVPGIGKTTLLRYLASLNVYDEWFTEPLPLLAKPFNDLTAEEQALLDGWVAKQLRDKNEALRREVEGSRHHQ
jgi:hypothetical protein